MSYSPATQPQINKIKAICWDYWKSEDNAFYHLVNMNLSVNHTDMATAGDIIDLLYNNPEEAKSRLKNILSKPI